jgi:hypothetical protein
MWVGMFCGLGGTLHDGPISALRTEEVVTMFGTRRTRREIRTSDVDVLSRRRLDRVQSAWGVLPGPRAHKPEVRYCSDSFQQRVTS